MKGSRSQDTMQNKQNIGHRPKPNTRDDLDSRKNEEWQTKGDDITHNQKEKKTGHLKNRGKDGSR